MTQIHVVIRRISPALKVDLVQIGLFEDNQFNPLSLDAVAGIPVARFFEKSDISDSLYIKHSDIENLIVACEGFPGFGFEFFDNTVVLMFNFNLNHDESAPKEEGKGN